MPYICLIHKRKQSPSLYRLSGPCNRRYSVMLRRLEGLIFMLAAAWASGPILANAFVFPSPPSSALAARTTWTGRPAAAVQASERVPYIATFSMAAGVTMPTPDTVIAKPSVGFAPEGATSIKAEDKFKVLLFNDNGNTREYVSRSLVQVVGLPEDTAYHIMQQANDNGMAQVGVWHQEMADAYSTSLKERGLISDVFPAD